jgi:hypothetical protein
LGSIPDEYRRRLTESAVAAQTREIASRRRAGRLAVRSEPEGHVARRTGACVSAVPSFDEHEQWLALLDDVGGKLGRVAAADVAHRVDRLGRDQEDLAGIERRGLAAVDGLLERALQDVDDLLARVLVPGRWRVGSDIDAILNDLAAGNAQIVALEIGAGEAGDWRRVHGNLRGSRSATMRIVRWKHDRVCGSWCARATRRCGGRGLSQA